MTLLVLIPAAKVGESWAEAQPWLDAACRRGGFLFGADHIEKKCKSGEWQLWAAISKQLEAVAVTEIQQHELGRAAVIYIVTGSKRWRWIHHLAAIKDWARDNGCKRVDCLARLGWWRVMRQVDPTCRATHVLLEWKL